MSETSQEVLRGTLDLLILRTAASGKVHGWAISERIQEVSEEVLQVGQGALYPALHRLEKRGLLESSWGISDNNRRARFYELTAAGRKHLASEEAGWQRFTKAVNLVLAEA